MSHMPCFDHWHRALPLLRSYAMSQAMMMVMAVFSSCKAWMVIVTWTAAWMIKAHQNFYPVCFVKCQYCQASRVCADCLCYVVLSYLLSSDAVPTCTVWTSTYTHTHTHPFNGPFSGTTQVSQYQKGKTNLDFTEARDSEWQWHQLGHMQVCTSLQTDNHASTPPLGVTKVIIIC